MLLADTVLEALLSELLTVHETVADRDTPAVARFDNVIEPPTVRVRDLDSLDRVVDSDCVGVTSKLPDNSVVNDMLLLELVAVLVADREPVALNVVVPDIEPDVVALVVTELDSVAEPFAVRVRDLELLDRVTDPVRVGVTCKLPDSRIVNDALLLDLVTVTDTDCGPVTLNVDVLDTEPVAVALP